MRSQSCRHVGTNTHAARPPGFRNHACVESFVDPVRTQAAHVSGVALAHFAPGFPGLYTALPPSDSPRNGSPEGTAGDGWRKVAMVVEGELLYPTDAQAAEGALAACDALEQYHGSGAEENMYERRRVTVRPATANTTTEVEASTYFVVYPHAMAEWGGEAVPAPKDGGVLSWRQFMQARGDEGAGAGWHPDS